jgi:hypothetical protein
MYPPEYDAGNKALPGFEADALFGSRPLAFYVRQRLDKPACPTGFHRVEQVRKLRPASQIIELPLTREANPLARDLAALDDIERIAVRDCGVIS